MASGYDKHQPEPPMNVGGWVIAIAFVVFVAIVVWRLATRT